MGGGHLTKVDLSAVALAKVDLSAVALAKVDLSAVALAKVEPRPMLSVPIHWIRLFFVVPGGTDVL
jgi:hypothetical protein